MKRLFKIGEIYQITMPGPNCIFKEIIVSIKNGKYYCSSGNIIEIDYKYNNEGYILYNNDMNNKGLRWYFKCNNVRKLNEKL